MARYLTTDSGCGILPNPEETTSLVASVPGGDDQGKTRSGAPAVVGQPGSDEGGAGYGLNQGHQQQQHQDQDQIYRYHPANINRGGESFFVSSGEESGGTKVNLAKCIGALCCLITTMLVVAGGIMLVTVKYGDADPVLLFGSILLVVAAGTCLCGCCALCVGTSKRDSGDSPEGDPNYREVKVRFRRLNDRFQKGCMDAEIGLQDVRLDVVGHMKEVKQALRKEAKDQKEKETKDREDMENRVKSDLKAGLSVKEIRQQYRPVVFYIDFDGDIMVSGLELLRKQVSLVVNLGKPGHDRCVVSITSPGGAVSQYGLAASQLMRIRNAGIHLTCCVDTVAASGGYMMASVANTICAAPFAVVGSIGVVTHIPNFQRFLDEHKVDAYLCTAGEYKRTIDIIGEVTEEGKEKMQEQLDDIHTAFKDHVALGRPQLKDAMDQVGTGEYWLAIQAKEKGLVDEIMTSDEYLESMCEEFDIIEILEKVYKPNGLDRLFGNETFEAAGKVVKTVADKVQTSLEQQALGPTAMAVV